MRIIQRLFFLSIFLPFTSIEADKTLTVSVYYPYGYIWVGPYQVMPVLSRYVIPVCLKGAEPKPPPTQIPFLTTATPTGPVTKETPTTMTTRRGDN